MSIGYRKIMTYFKILKQTYMTHKTSLFEYVVRVYPIETIEKRAAELSSVRAEGLCFSSNIHKI